MDTEQQRDLLLLLKTLADEQRLTMLGLMSQRECTVTEMAGLLELSEPTISHHVSKMHSAGLLRLRGQVALDADHLVGVDQVAVGRPEVQRLTAHVAKRYVGHCWLLQVRR